MLACRLMCSNDITRSNIQLVDALLLHFCDFCRRLERLYGNESITPNMHMHAHLAECISDYGPCHGFWASPLKGIMAYLRTNLIIIVPWRHNLPK